MKFYFKYLSFVVLFSLSFHAFSQSTEIGGFSFGPVNLGDSRIPVDLDHFKIKHDLDKNKFRFFFKKDSIQWVRGNNNLLSPRAIMVLNIKDSKDFYTFKYHGKDILPEKSRSQFYTELFITLFEPGKIIIFKNGKKLGNILIEAQVNGSNVETHLIDDSCKRFNLNVEGLEEEYMSVGCRLERVGKFGEERGRLEVNWTATNYTLLNKSRPPYIAVISKNRPVVAQVVNKKGEVKTIKIMAKVPKRMHRLKLAVGFGPYGLDATEDRVREKDDVAPAFFLYGRYDFTAQTSARFFDALVWRTSLFNNSGVYFAYELSNVLDQRVSIVPLLGFQGLTFKLNSDTEQKTNIIYPQGFEAVWHHAFGMDNYKFVYGMFLSTSSNEPYKNLWIRFGKGYFWELNYIDFEISNQKAKTYGLSVGIPIGSFF